MPRLLGFHHVAEDLGTEDERGTVQGYFHQSIYLTYMLVDIIVLGPVSRLFLS
jgi:hypothetical protein